MIYRESSRMAGVTQRKLVLKTSKQTNFKSHDSWFMIQSFIKSPYLLILSHWVLSSNMGLFAGTRTFRLWHILTHPSFIAYSLLYTCLVWFYWDKVLLCSPWWSGTHNSAQTSLELVGICPPPSTCFLAFDTFVTWLYVEPVLFLPKHTYWVFFGSDSKDDDLTHVTLLNIIAYLPHLEENIRLIQSLTYSNSNRTVAGA